MTSVSPSPLPTHSFLTEARVICVGQGQVEATGEDKWDALAAESAQRSAALVCQTPKDLPDAAVAAIAIPVFRESEVVSVVLLAANREVPADIDGDEQVGVFEVWEPVGPYEEVALAAGYYGKMERFHNVSSFVRFERGTGLPGQVWHKRMGVIHDDLSNHPGFLRAAGASADLLQTAVGIPVFHESFVASVLLISSHRTPIARGFEVWQSCEDGFEMLGASYTDFDPGFALKPEARMAADEGWAGLIAHSRNAVMSHDPEFLKGGRACEEDGCSPASGLAIPRFEGSKLHSFVTLLF